MNVVWWLLVLLTLSVDPQLLWLVPAEYAARAVVRWLDEQSVPCMGRRAEFAASERGE